jgi:hypothetical protein
LDIISELRNPSLEVELQDPATINFVEDTIPDLISGVVTTLTIEQLYVTDRCAIPKI